MNQSLPITIDNGSGETLIFHRIESAQGEEKLIIENFVAPGSQPLLHINRLQDEALTVLHGRLGFQLEGEEAQFAGIGGTAVFPKGRAHRFWNAGPDELNCFGWIKPANNSIFYLTSLYNAMKESTNGKPEQFDTAYLLYRYKNEYEMPGLPRFVKSVVIPATYALGKWTGRYRKFKDAPLPVAGS